MKKSRFISIIIIMALALMLVGCDLSGGGDDLGENEAKIKNSESTFVGSQYQEVVDKLQECGFTNIETVAVYDIFWGITKEGTTKSVTIDGSNKFKSGDVFNKDVAIVVTYSMKESNDPTKQKYTITWQYEDGVIIKTDQVMWGKTPKYTGTVPTKKSTNETKYTFTGWSPEIVAVSSNITYIAQFSEEDVLYQVSYRVTDVVKQIIGGGVHSLALTNNNQVYSWGQNFYGQLGDETKKDKGTPINITDKFILDNDESIIKLESGSHHSLALTSTGRVFSWGLNTSGQLGDGTTINKSAPTEITELFYLKSNEKIVGIFSGERSNHSLAITSTGRIFSWGANNYGQLGDGTYIRKIIPVDITSYFGMQVGETIAFALGDNHTLAVTSNGRVFSWGRNNVGQLGHGSTSDTEKLIPVMFNVMFDLYSDERIVLVSASLEHSQALSSKGRIFSWGVGKSAQHGDGTFTDKVRPTDVTSGFDLVTGEVLISTYSIGSTSFAITSKNRIFGWGHNLYGQAGDGTTISKAIPIEITNRFILNEGEYISNIVGGFYSSTAFSSNGRVFSIEGQLGEKRPVDITGYISKPVELKKESYKLGEIIIEYIPIREGFIFGGWFIDSALSQQYEFGTMPGENIELYVKWIPID